MEEVDETQLLNTLVENPSDKEHEIKVFGSTYSIPPNSAFLMVSTIALYRASFCG
jgi:hypothetical protein